MIKAVASNLLTIPNNIGRAIVEAAAFNACPLLAADRFVSFCKKRGLSIDRERLFRLERLRLFAPVFRVLTPEEDVPAFSIPLCGSNNWFEKGWALLLNFAFIENVCFLRKKPDSRKKFR